MSETLSVSEQIQNDYLPWGPLFLSFFFWSMFYYIVRNLFPNKSAEWCSRLVTFFHGFGSAVNGISECFPEVKGLFECATEPMTDNQKVILIVSFGYFLHDTMWCLYYQTESLLMLVHHILSTFSVLRLLQKDITGAQSCCALGGLEMTNPLLQIRWFLRYEGYKNSQCFTIVEMIFATIFLSVRLGFGTYFVIKLVFLQENDWDYIFMAAALYIVSVLFVVNIIQYIVHKYVPKKSVASVSNQ